MFKVLFTIDYEIHGNGDGSPYQLMVEPTYRMMSLFDKYGAKLTIMADVAEILKFKEYFDTYGEDKFDYNKIVKQLKYAINHGHDVQLHIHSGYFQSEFTEHGIKQKWDEYDLANLSYEKIYDRVKTSKEFLEKILREEKKDYQCIAFRAANWSMVPTKNISQALIDNGIKIDTSVFKGGVRTGRVKFDYTEAFDKLLPWYIDQNDICKEDKKGELLEIPIYTEMRYFWSFVSVVRSFRMIRARFHKHASQNESDESMKEDSSQVELKPAVPKKKKSKIQKLLGPFIKKHSWKLDLNQASGTQLKNAVKRIEKEYDGKDNIPIVLIGHSKSFISYNEKTLEPFLRYIAKNSSKHRYSLFEDIDINKYKD